MIDTHCHLTFPDFAAPGAIEAELAECAALGVKGCITISTTTVDCLEALAVAHRFTNVWCTSGIHPLYAHKDPLLWHNLRAVAGDHRCVAWGELGLDNHHAEPPAKTQRDILEQQLTHIAAWRAEGIDKPVVVHCREAFDDLIPILRAWSEGGGGVEPHRFVFHCFTGGPADVAKVLEFGACVSFTGVSTYRNAREVREAAALVPLDRLMVETDAPFLAPEPHRGKWPCRPAWTRFVAEALAAHRGITFDELHAAVNANTSRFFGIPLTAC